MTIRILQLGLLLISLTSTAIAGDRVYQYRGNDGLMVFTDRKIHGQKPVSVKYYGRPPAVTQCNTKAATLKNRVKSYWPHIQNMSERYDIDPDLIKAVITTESCFNPKAVSRVGAQGLMQLMPDTSRMLGVSDPFDPEQNIDGGVRYLRMMLDQFNQNKKLALAAYNAGPQAVKKYGKVPPYQETQRYVKKILAMI